MLKRTNQILKNYLSIFLRKLDFLLYHIIKLTSFQWFNDKTNVVFIFKNLVKLYNIWLIQLLEYCNLQFHWFYFSLTHLIIYIIFYGYVLTIYPVFGFSSNANPPLPIVSPILYVYLISLNLAWSSIFLIILYCILLYKIEFKLSCLYINYKGDSNYYWIH